MGFKIAVHPTRVLTLQDYGWTAIQIINSYADSGCIARYFGQHNGKLTSQKLPMDFEGTISVPLAGVHNGKHTILSCAKGNPSPTGDRRGKSSKHRVTAVCPDCSARVPAGRTVQHKCKGSQ